MQIMRCLVALIWVAHGQPWEDWLKNFGHDSFRYPDWIRKQMQACSCELEGLEVVCRQGAFEVDWAEASELTWCTARHFLLSHMPSFDLQFLPGAVSVEGSSMLDDNIAFALMAWNASKLTPRPPLPVVFPYLLPYASYHEAQPCRHIHVPFLLRTNWRPPFFAKYFALAASQTSSRGVVDALISDGVRLMNWTSFRWPGYSGKSANVYELGPFASGSTPPVVAPADFLLYGYGSCTAWAKFLASALRAVGVPAREVGSPCWNTGIFAGLATSNPNVSQCWQGGTSTQVGGQYLNNHNWVEYWDNELQSWHFLDVATSSSAEKTWFCGSYQQGCSCSSNAGKAMQDHEILAPTWGAAGSDPRVHGGTVLDVATSLRLSNGEAVSPLVWSPQLKSPLGLPLKNVGLRVVNRTDFYRCRQAQKILV
ncbi:unnamed protein product [Effrenium voratum]|uniref:Transglutaminase-like domain-containing protein n=1 Tax=Effrenium voratum TaxID=2562239 RepID=A0AA36IBS1_9DINO|nr:unnamed protein product [Effrenium voratum]